MSSVKKIIHKHSSVVDKLPRTDELDYGEIAINYASGKEFISLKNADNQIIKITPSSEQLFRYDNNTKNGIVPTSQGNGCQAKGEWSFAEGFATKALENCSHAEGRETTTNGSCSHAEGFATKTTNMTEHASGQCNISTQSTGGTDINYSLFTIGNGESLSSRHNAFEVKKSGEIFIQKDKVNTSEMISLQDKLSEISEKQKAMETDLSGINELLNKIIGES